MDGKLELDPKLGFCNCEFDPKPPNELPDAADPGVAALNPKLPLFIAKTTESYYSTVTLSTKVEVSQLVDSFFFFLARGLGVKVKGRVEKQDCNEQ